jgi:putative transcriptional regulator
LLEPTREGVIAIIDFSPMWQTMEEKGITQYKLLKSGIDNKTLDTLKKNNNITLLTLEKICNILDCTPNDIVRFTDNKKA